MIFPPLLPSPRAVNSTEAVNAQVVGLDCSPPTYRSFWHMAGTQKHLGKLETRHTRVSPNDKLDAANICDHHTRHTAGQGWRTQRQVRSQDQVRWRMPRSVTTQKPPNCVLQMHDSYCLWTVSQQSGLKKKKRWIRPRVNLTMWILTSHMLSLEPNVPPLKNKLVRTHRPHFITSVRRYIISTGLVCTC